MDIYTKIIIINWVLLLTVTYIDRITHDALENNKYIAPVIYFWAGLSVFAIPVWLIYLVLRTD